jgi:hypothetical protein
MNDVTHISTKQLKDNNVVFIVGDSPTVTFNENVTVYTYPNMNYKEEVSEEVKEEVVEVSTSPFNKFLKSIKNKFKVLI